MSELNPRHIDAVLGAINLCPFFRHMSMAVTEIGLSAAVSWNRHGGMETTHLSHLYAFFTLDMIPAATHAGISPLGASAVASRHEEGAFDPGCRIGVAKDQAGLASAEACLSRALELVELVGGSQKAGSDHQIQARLHLG